MCTLPNILNGYQVSSYVFLGQMPDSYWCATTDLSQTNWSPDEIRNITTGGFAGKIDNCNILNLEYNQLSHLTFDEALNYTNEQTEIVSCSSKSNSYYVYDQEPDISIVPEWNLVCDKSALRSTVQVALSVGKLMGAFTSGVFADKYGRKQCFILGAISYIAGSALATVSPWYWLFIIGRFFIGVAASALFYPSYTLSKIVNFIYCYTFR